MENIPRLIGRSVLVLLLLALFLVAEGMRINPHALDQKLGVVVHLVAAFLAFCALHWRWLGVPEPGQRHVRFVAIVLVVVGAIDAAAFYFLGILAFNPWPGRFAVTIWLGLGAPLGLAVVGAALLGNLRWAPAAARLIAFPLSLGWPIGLIVSLYTWWALSRPKQS